MHASSFIALLAASAATATPLMARNTQPSYAPAPTGEVPPASSGYHSGAPGGDSPKPDAPKDNWSSAPAPAQPSGTKPAGGKPAETSILGNPNATPNAVPPPGTVGELLTADSVVARFTDLKEDFDAGTLSLVFDHNPAANPNVMPGEGGQVDLANRGEFALHTSLVHAY